MCCELYIRIGTPAGNDFNSRATAASNATRVTAFTCASFNTSGIRYIIPTVLSTTSNIVTGCSSRAPSGSEVLHRSSSRPSASAAKTASAGSSPIP